MSLPLAITKTEIEGFPCRRGKVRDVYDLGDKLVIVTTDRISAFDWVLADGVPDKRKNFDAANVVLDEFTQG